MINNMLNMLFLSYAAASRMFPRAMQSLDQETYDSSDIRMYVFNNEFYNESHDELTLLVWRSNEWVELNFNDRPSKDLK